MTPVLLYLVALRLFSAAALALFSAVVLALTPPQVILSRQALDYVCPLPFMLGWLWFLIDYTETTARLQVAGRARRAVPRRGLLQLHRLVGDDADLPRAVGDRVLARHSTRDRARLARSLAQGKASWPLVASTAGFVAAAAGVHSVAVDAPGDAARNVRSLPDVGPGSGVADPGAAQRASARQAGRNRVDLLELLRSGVPVHDRRAEHDHVDRTHRRVPAAARACCCRSASSRCCGGRIPSGFTR